jgi:antirestriction protein ArdC
MTSSEMQQRALSNARFGQSLGNYATIYSGFIEKGVPESDILPRINVLTFNAWKALGRSVRKGEHGVRVVTFVPVAGKPSANGETPRAYKLPRTVTVFHVSQTQEGL